MLRQRGLLRSVLTTLATLTTLLGVPAVTHAADYADVTADVGQFASGTVQRFRRANSLGPTVALAGPNVSTEGSTDLALSFGLGLYHYDVPLLPSPSEIKDLILARVKERVMEHAKAMVARGEPAPTQAQLDAYGREVLAEVKAYVLGQLERPAKLLEKPVFALDLEWAMLLGVDASQTRLTVGYGVGRVTLGPTLTYDTEDANAVLLGPQVDLRILPGKGPRSPVIDVFVRADFALSERAIHGDTYGAGARILLDLL